MFPPPCSPLGGMVAAATIAPSNEGGRSCLRASQEEDYRQLFTNP